MGYCRYENTVLALEECIEALECDGLENLSDSEKTYAKGLQELANDYIEAYSKQKKQINNTLNKNNL